ncbi:hypothetical protein IU500_03545 [Nocardia terpenica]|uniref:hypothetical protein n=1 Tax=Nocardia terpenica TaxID=455432 RepID=UPI0018962E3A|nr:hypothetical protein [Nocardia terpenica]MBF6059345.1 hypothetical protein [Nocardia terpenica]MBF6103116.1 hypothetical protein [Nocardia terpenica]MBF6110695.1 hypothetical protein [Nocardia terpenica]MBF6116826.1 hypothetical protein [Nocardia terpenica]
MTVRQIPWTDLRQLPQLLRHSWRRHRASGADLADLTFVTSWRTGPAAHAAGPYMFSFTQYTPARARDIPGILLAGASLADQLLRIDTAVGFTAYLRPARNRQLGSLSVWTDPTGLDTFIPLPDHIETMNKYRPRALDLPIRSATWWSDHLDIDAALTHGLHLLDTHSTQRVSLPRT